MGEGGEGSSGIKVIISCENEFCSVSFLFLFFFIFSFENISRIERYWKISSWHRTYKRQEAVVRKIFLRSTHRQREKSSSLHSAYPCT